MNEKWHRKEHIAYALLFLVVVFSLFVSPTFKKKKKKIKQNGCKLSGQILKFNTGTSADKFCIFISFYLIEFKL